LSGSERQFLGAGDARCRRILPVAHQLCTNRAGAFSGALVLTDNNLNAVAPGYTAQSIALSVRALNLQSARLQP